MDAIIENLPTFLGGFWTTLQLLLFSGAGALVLGTLIAAMRISPVSALRVFATVYTEILRNIPLTLVLFFCAFLLPYLGAKPLYFVFAIVGLTAYTSPFIAEAIRSGINGVALGQAEAARALGLTFGQTLRLIVLPQGIRMVIPPLLNVIIALTKNTSVAGGFFVVELFATSRQLVNIRGDSTLAILLAVAVFYLVITVPLGQVAARLERKVAVFR
jgi:glutamate transport system permease protein